MKSVRRMPAWRISSLNSITGDFTLPQEEAPVAPQNTLPTQQCSHEPSAPRPGACLPSAAPTAPPPTIPCRPTTRTAASLALPSRPPMPCPLPPRAARGRLCRRAPSRARSCACPRPRTARESGAGASSRARRPWLARVLSRLSWPTRYV